MHIKNKSELKLAIKNISLKKNSQRYGCKKRKEIIQNIIKAIKISASDEETRSFALFLKNLTRIQKCNYEASFGIGVVGHLGPGNVPINALYSWSIGYWCGNTNITRISSRSDEKVKEIVDTICKIIEANGENEIFVSEMSGEEFLKTISYSCDGRVLWGSDSVLDEIKRKVPVKKNNRDICFGTKITAGIFDIKELKKLTTASKQRIIQCLANDFFYEYGAPCTSPSCVITIVNKSGESKIIDELLDEAAHEAKKRYQWTMEYFSKREKIIQEEIMYGGNTSLWKGERSNIVILKPNELTGRKRNNLLIESYEVDTKTDIINIVRSKYNNFVCFGADIKLIEDLKREKSTKGVQSLGKAHLFTTNWDGIDLISTLSRSDEL